MKYSAQILTLLTSLFLLACRSADNFRPLETVEEAQYLTKVKSFKETFTFVKKLNLQVMKPIGSVTTNGIRISEDRILLALGGKNEELMIFDTSGNQIASINKRGYAPGEFLFINNFCIKDSRIFLYDKIQKKINTYDKNGSFINQFQVRNNYHSMDVISGRIFLSKIPLSFGETENDIIDVYNLAGDLVDTIAIPLLVNSDHSKKRTFNKLILLDESNFLVGSGDDMAVYKYNIKQKNIVLKTVFLPEWLKLNDENLAKEKQAHTDTSFYRKWLNGLHSIEDIIIIGIQDKTNSKVIIYDRNGNYLTDFPVTNSPFTCAESKLYVWSGLNTGKERNSFFIVYKVYELSKTKI